MAGLKLLEKFIVASLSPQKVDILIESLACGPVSPSLQSFLDECAVVAAADIHFVHALTVIAHLQIVVR